MSIVAAVASTASVGCHILASTGMIQVLSSSYRVCDGSVEEGKSALKRALGLPWIYEKS